MENRVLSDEQIEEAVSTLHVAWSHIPGQGLVRVFETGGFADGLALVGKVVQLAEQQGHNPTLVLRHNEVEITTTTEDMGGVTNQDVKLAKAVDAVAHD